MADKKRPSEEEMAALRRAQTPEEEWIVRYVFADDGSRAGLEAWEALREIRAAKEAGKRIITRRDIREAEVKRAWLSHGRGDTEEE